MKLELFKYDTCPYCVRVMRTIDELGIKDQVEYCDIHKDQAALERLVTVGGKRQVPCLFIDGKPLYESSDIISWLRGNL